MCIFSTRINQILDTPLEIILHRVKCHKIIIDLWPCHTVQFFLQLATQFCSEEMQISDDFLICDGNMYLQILHLPGVELRCKLQEKLYRVSGFYHYLVIPC